MKDLTKYWETVQADVCSNCIDSDGEGVCRVAGEVECGLKRYFSAVVDSVLSVQSDMLGPYEKALRENVCGSCDHQSEEGACHVRTNVDCGLDRYFPMIVESIENFRSEHNGILTNSLRPQ